MYTYVSCRPDIGYPITLMSKYASSPFANHYDKLKNIAKYLQTTCNWGIIFKISSPRTELPKGTTQSILINDKLPIYLETVKSSKLVGYVNAAYSNNPKRRRSTTGYTFTYKLNPMWLSALLKLSLLLLSLLLRL